MRVDGAPTWRFQSLLVRQGRPSELPLLLLLIPGALMAAIAGWRFRLRLGGKRVAILGDRSTGKSTLLSHLQQASRKGSAERADGPAPSGSFALEVKGRSIEFKVPSDLPGGDGLGLSSWKEAFRDSQYVWYLFRADLIAVGDQATIDTVRSHIDTFRNWLEKDKLTPPTIVLIGTFADASPEYRLGSDRVWRLVEGAQPIRTGTVKLNNASLVVGSLLTTKGRARLTADLTRVL